MIGSFESRIVSKSLRLVKGNKMTSRFEREVPTFKNHESTLKREKCKFEIESWDVKTQNWAMLKKWNWANREFHVSGNHQCFT